MDTRIFKVLSGIKYFSYSPEFITLKEPKIPELQSRVEELNDLIGNDKLIRFHQDNPGVYRKMLYSEKDLIDCCKG